MSLFTDTVKPAEETGKTAKTQKVVSIKGGTHKFAGAGNVKATKAAGLNTDSFTNGSQNISAAKHAESVITVTPTTPALTALAVHLAPASVKVGAKSAITVTPTPAGADVSGVVFTSGTVANATVAGHEATGVKAGTSVITAKVGSITGTATLTVTATK